MNVPGIMSVADKRNLEPKGSYFYAPDTHSRRVR
nr:MAG TPA: hypothetical protein [Caudoviricetes sp.]DAE66849.1 MAG TPA: hypothetical protein [Bacteriophage sp.]DAJ96661.1 MAG TPA: hypothetical protein [Caudoviricetes sp.]DAR45412.1 MAG TPA: hypothetical protein [Caudoviricetes sp.]DAV79666.1 MAG TPA: hypothetical protein [Bacteriophage sp.]